MAKNKAAVSLGRRGGLKGGKARAKAMTAEQLSAGGTLAVSARWADGRKRRRSCVVCGRRVLATSREFDAVGRTCEEHRHG
jgi:hypothetical protein